MRLIYLLVVAVVFGALPLAASALDQNDEMALKNVEALLANPSQLNALGKEDPRARQAMDKAREITQNDPKKMAEINSISSAAFADLVKKHNGDSAAIMEELQRAMQDPKAFMNGLSPEQQSRIRALGAEIDQKNATR